MLYYNTVTLPRIILVVLTTDNKWISHAAKIPTNDLAILLRDTLLYPTHTLLRTLQLNRDYKIEQGYKIEQIEQRYKRYPTQNFTIEQFYLNTFIFLQFCRRPRLIKNP